MSDAISARQGAAKLRRDPRDEPSEVISLTEAVYQCAEFVLVHEPPEQGEWHKHGWGPTTLAAMAIVAEPRRRNAWLEKVQKHREHQARVQLEETWAKRRAS